jgi:hypothetical protein
MKMHEANSSGKYYRNWASGAAQGGLGGKKNIKNFLKKRDFFRNMCYYDVARL